MKIDESVALVTGGSSGLGLATARALISAGATVVVADIAEPPIDTTYVRTDVTDEEQVAAVVHTASELGPVRIVVCCAGIAPSGRVVGRSGPLPLTDFERAVRINLIGTFNVVRLAAVAMQATLPVDGERGVMITTASVAAFDGQIGQAAYAASKGGVAAMTLPLARDLSSSLIRVMSIAPGIFETPMMAGFTDEVRDSLGSQVPHPSRLGRPDEYAALAQHIIENPYLNGETIRLDGAIRMGPR